MQGLELELDFENVCKDSISCLTLRKHHAFTTDHVKHGKLGKITDSTHFPADLVDREALPRDEFARFSSSVYEDKHNTHT